MGMVKQATWKKPFTEKYCGEYIYHVYPTMEDALMHERDYTYAGWLLTGWDDDPRKCNPFLDNAWCKKLIQPKTGGTGWVR